jgi:DnaA family protein
MQQLPLTLRWPAQQRFDTFVAGDNAGSVALLRDTSVNADGNWIFLSGAAGCGKTHLLVSACADASAADRVAQYLVLRGVQASAIRALGGSEVLALDELDAIAGDAEAEHALFDLYNRCKVEKSTLLFGADKPPAHLGIGLPDLVSRLASCTQVTLKPLSEDQRREAVRQRAEMRGLILDDAVLDWLFAHTPRDLGSLTALIERLDRESLAAKRRITLPFLRSLLDGETKNG